MSSGHDRRTTIVVAVVALLGSVGAGWVSGYYSASNTDAQLTAQKRAEVYNRRAEPYLALADDIRALIDEEGKFRKSVESAAPAGADEAIQKAENDLLNSLSKMSPKLIADVDKVRILGTDSAAETATEIGQHAKYLEVQASTREVAPASLPNPATHSVNQDVMPPLYYEMMVAATADLEQLQERFVENCRSDLA